MPRKYKTKRAPTQPHVKESGVGFWTQEETRKHLRANFRKDWYAVFGNIDAVIAFEDKYYEPGTPANDDFQVILVPEFPPRPIFYARVTELIHAMDPNARWENTLLLGLTPIPRTHYMIMEWRDINPNLTSRAIETEHLLAYLLDKAPWGTIIADARDLQDSYETGGRAMTSEKWNNIPQELKELPQWVLTNDKKLPVNPYTEELAKMDDPSTWGVWGVVETEKLIGFSLASFTGIDFDHIYRYTPYTPFCIEAMDWLVKFAEVTYCEYSISGTGAHVIGVCLTWKLPPSNNTVFDPASPKVPEYDRFGKPSFNKDGTPREKPDVRIEFAQPVIGRANSRGATLRNDQ